MRKENIVLQTYVQDRDHQGEVEIYLHNQSLNTTLFIRAIPTCATPEGISHGTEVGAQVPRCFLYVIFFLPRERSFRTHDSTS